MSALGQKQTCAVQTVMSALPLKADMDQWIALTNYNGLSRARRYWCCTMTLVPTGTREYRSITSSLTIRKQPDDTA